MVTSIHTIPPLRRPLLWCCIALSIAALIASEFVYDAASFVDFDDVQVIYALILALFWLVAMLKTSKTSLIFLGTIILFYCLIAWSTLDRSLYVNHIAADVLREEQRKYEIGDTLFIIGTLFSVTGYGLLLWRYRSLRRGAAAFDRA